MISIKDGLKEKVQQIADPVYNELIKVKNPTYEHITIKNQIALQIFIKGKICNRIGRQIFAYIYERNN